MNKEIRVILRIRIHLSECMGMFRPNKKICVFLVTGLKILGRIGTHISFLEKYIILSIWKGISLFYNE